MGSSKNVSKVIEILKEYLKNVNDIIAVSEIHREFNDPFKTLVSTIISTRTREEVTIEVSKRLFERIKTVEDLKKMDIDELTELLKPAGFYKRKAKQLKELAEILIEKFNGEVPNKREELVSLPGVGVKVANVVLERAFNKDYIAVDTHVHRIANRLGWVKTKTPEETEKKLYKIVPKKYWKDLNVLFVKFGRNVCKPVKLKCNICPVKGYCEYFKKRYGQKNL